MGTRALAACIRGSGRGRRAMVVPACGLFGRLRAELEWSGVGATWIHRRGGNSGTVDGDPQSARFREPGVHSDGLGRGMDWPGNQLGDPPVARGRGVFSLACFYRRDTGQFLSGSLPAECVLQSCGDPLPDAVAAVHSGRIWDGVDPRNRSDGPRRYEPCGALGGFASRNSVSISGDLGQAGGRWRYSANHFPDLARSRSSHRSGRG